MRPAHARGGHGQTRERETERPDQGHREASRAPHMRRARRHGPVLRRRRRSTRAHQRRREGSNRIRRCEGLHRPAHA